MKRKPKLINWLKLIFVWIPFVLLLIWGFYHQFYKSYPEIPKPFSWDYAPINSPAISIPVAETLIDKLVIGGNIVKLNSGTDSDFYSVLTSIKENSESKNNVDENLKKQLKAEIDDLVLKKISLENNISELGDLNAKLSKISFEMQEAIIRFVEKNRVRDMFASALVGAIISVFLTFILMRPVITKKIDNWLWKYINGKTRDSDRFSQNK